MDTQLLRWKGRHRDNPAASAETLGNLRRGQQRQHHTDYHRLNCTQLCISGIFFESNSNAVIVITEF